MSAGGQHTIARLLHLMDSSPGFSALGATVKTISSISGLDDGGLKEITTAILRDAALTARLLSLANSSRNALGAGSITTVDQAITILGFNTVRSAALSLTLLECLSRKPQSSLLHAEIVAAYFCGSLAAQITRSNAPQFGTQETQVCGLLQNIGRMMAIYHLYEEIEASRALMAEDNLAEDEAAARALGTSYEAMGAAVAHHWKLPDEIVAGIASRITGIRQRMPENLGWHQLCALFARRVTNALFRLPEDREKTDIEVNVKLFAEVLQLKEDEVRQWTREALEETDGVLGEIGFPCNVAQARNQLRRTSGKVLDRLSSQDSLTKKDISQPNRKTPVEICQQAMRVIHDAYGFDRTLLCLPDGGMNLTAVAGVGVNAMQVAAGFRCSGDNIDIFRLVLYRQVDMYIADSRARALAAHIPRWYRELVDAPSFMLLSLAYDGRELGLIYGDYSASPEEPPQNIAAREEVKRARDQMQAALLSRARKLRY